MAVLEATGEKTFDIHNEWSEVMGSEVCDRPVFVQRAHDDVIVLSLPMFNSLFSSLKFNVSLFTESDGSVTGVVDGLDLVENAETKEGCIAALLAAMRDYAQDFYNDFKFWASASNRKDHIPYVLKILSGSDAQLREDIICRDGRI